MAEEIDYIPHRLKNASVGGHVCGANDIIDDDANKLQSEINALIKTMGASGNHHSGGLVPDPGSTQGNTKFLREDGLWALIVGLFAQITTIYDTAHTDTLNSYTTTGFYCVRDSVLGSGIMLVWKTIPTNSVHNVCQIFLKSSNGGILYRSTAIWSDDFTNVVWKTVPIT